MRKKKIIKYIGKNWFLEKRPFSEFDDYEHYYWQLTNNIFVLLKNFAKFYGLIISKDEIKELAYLLSGYFEDIRNDIGFWSILENKYLELYNSTLPLIIDEDSIHFQHQITEESIRYIMWNYFVFHLKIPIALIGNENCVIPFSQKIYISLCEYYDEAPITNKWKSFLTIENEDFLFVKEILKWFAEDSYLFRSSYLRHIHKREHNENDNWAVHVDTEEEYLFHTTTTWASLAPLNIFSEILIINPKRREEIRSWNKKNTSIYKVININSTLIKFKNLYTEKIYEILIVDFPVVNFKQNWICLGGFQYYNGCWHLSGSMSFSEVEFSTHLQPLLIKMMNSLYKHIYRYDSKLLAIAKQRHLETKDAFIKFFGSEFVTFTSGKELQRKYSEYLNFTVKDFDKNLIKEKREELGFDESNLNTNIPETLLTNNDTGIFYNPIKGLEIFTSVSKFIQLLKNKKNSQIDRKTIIEYICEPTISTNFFLYLHDHYSFRNVELAFGFSGLEDKNKLLFFLRSLKPEDFGFQVPNVAILNFSEPIIK